MACSQEMFSGAFFIMHSSGRWVIYEVRLSSCSPIHRIPPRFLDLTLTTKSTKLPFLHISALLPPRKVVLLNSSGGLTTSCCMFPQSTSLGRLVWNLCARQQRRMLPFPPYCIRITRQRSANDMNQVTKKRRGKRSCISAYSFNEWGNSDV